MNKNAIFPKMLLFSPQFQQVFESESEFMLRNPGELQVLLLWLLFSTLVMLVTLA
jgi:hypothetical protein